MLKIKDFSEEIDALYKKGFTAFDIYKKLNIKYPQPIYNYFKKKGWERKSRKDYKHKIKYSVNESFFECIDTEEKAYILGFICADGHIAKYGVKISLKDSDYKLLDKIRDAMESNHPIVRNIKAENPYKKSKNTLLYKCSISFNRATLSQQLRDKGLRNDKTYTLNSDIMKYIPEDLVRHFMRGYFDGDGNILWGKEYSSGKKYSISVCGNEEFLINVFNKNFPSNTKLYKVKNSKQCNTWCITSKEEVLRFLSFLYSDANIYLDRKYNLYKYALWSFKTGLIAGNSYFIEILKGQSAANLLVKSLQQVQRLANETILNPYEEGNIEYNLATNAQH